MSGEKGYYTLSAPGRDEFMERKSRFIGQAAPVETEEDALAFIKTARENDKAASHHCFAYIIGANAGIMRYQDDGEPQGTAGIPILEVLKKNGLVNCVCVVTRYFGGVLLGAGGLTRAYAQGAALAVNEAGIVLAQQSARLGAVFSYAHWDKADYALGRLPVCQIEKTFSDKVAATMTVRLSDLAFVEKELTSLSDGSASFTVSDPFYHLWPAEGTPEET